METHRPSQDFQVNVKINATPREDLAKILAGIRKDYEAIIEKNHQDLDAWFQKQVTHQYPFQDLHFLHKNSLSTQDYAETLLENNLDALIIHN